MCGVTGPNSAPYPPTGPWPGAGPLSRCHPRPRRSLSFPAPVLAPVPAPALSAPSPSVGPSPQVTLSSSAMDSDGAEAQIVPYRRRWNMVLVFHDHTTHTLPPPPWKEHLGKVGRKPPGSPAIRSRPGPSLRNLLLFVAQHWPTQPPPAALLSGWIFGGWWSAGRCQK